MVHNYDIITDYAIFTHNVLNFIDNGNWSSSFKFRIKQKNFKKILQLLVNLSKNDVDAAVVFSFLNYKGIGI